MWPKSYKDYPKDSPLVQNRVESGNGIIGCEMSEPNGWGETMHVPRATESEGLFSTFWKWLLGKEQNSAPHQNSSEGCPDSQPSKAKVQKK